MAARLSPDTSSFYANFSQNSLSVSANTYEKNIVRKNSYVAHHDDKLFFLPKCRYHFVLIGGIDELLREMDAFCSTYQH